MAEFDEQREFLSIEGKVDTADKVAYAADKPHNEFFWSFECNSIVKAINLLRRIIALTPSQVQQIIATGDEIALGTIVVDFLTYINNSVTAYDLGVDGTTFITFKFEDIDYVYSFVGEARNYGSGLVPLENSDVLLLYTSESGASVTPSAFEQCTLMISQSGVPGAPTIDVMDPSGFSPSITATTFSTGSYKIAINDVDDPAKIVFIFSPQLGLIDGEIISAKQIEESLFIDTTNGGSYADGLLNRWPVTVLKFN